MTDLPEDSDLPEDWEKHPSKHFAAMSWRHTEMQLNIWLQIKLAVNKQTMTTEDLISSNKQSFYAGMILCLDYLDGVMKGVEAGTLSEEAAELVVESFGQELNHYQQKRVADAVTAIALRRADYSSKHQGNSNDPSNTSPDPAANPRPSGGQGHDNGPFGHGEDPQHRNPG